MISQWMNAMHCLFITNKSDFQHELLSGAILDTLYVACTMHNISKGTLLKTLYHNILK